MLKRKMEKFIDWTIRMIERMPLSIQGIILLVLSSGFITYRILTNDKLRNMIFTRLAKRMSKISKMSLYTAPVFYRKEFFKRKIENLNFEGEPEKTKVFRLLLDVKLETDVQCLEKLLKEEEYIHLNKYELVAYLTGNVNQMIKSFEKALKQKLTDEYGEKTGTQLYHFVMFSRGGYSDKRIPRVDRILHEINEVIGISNIFDNNYERVAAYMHEIHYAIYVVVTQTEKMFREFNGEIKKIINNKN